MPITRYLLLAGIVALVSGWWLWQQAEDREHSKAIAVSTLPDGVEARFIAALDNELEHTIRREGKYLIVRDSFLDGETVIRAVTSFAVDCYGVSTINVDFHLGDGSPNIFLGGREWPTLGVDPQSVAAKKLRKIICQRTRLYISQRLEGMPLAPPVTVQEAVEYEPPDDDRDSRY